MALTSLSNVTMTTVTSSREPTSTAVTWQRVLDLMELSQIIELAVHGTMRVE